MCKSAHFLVMIALDLDAKFFILVSGVLLALVHSECLIIFMHAVALLFRIDVMIYNDCMIVAICQILRSRKHDIVGKVNSMRKFD